MDSNEYPMAYRLPDGERIAILETENKVFREELKDIGKKLDELLELKAKGFGALSLVTLLLGSGAIGLVILLVNMFRGH